MGHGANHGDIIPWKDKAECLQMMSSIKYSNIRYTQDCIHNFCMLDKENCRGENA